MRTDPTSPMFAWACDVLGVRAPALRGDGGPEDRRAWSAWKARTVESAARFVPGRSDLDVHLARDVLLATPLPRTVAAPSRMLAPEARAHLLVQFDRFGLD